MTAGIQTDPTSFRWGEDASLHGAALPGRQSLALGGGVLVWSIGLHGKQLACMRIDQVEPLAG